MLTNSTRLRFPRSPSLDSTGLGGAASNDGERGTLTVEVPPIFFSRSFGRLLFTSSRVREDIGNNHAEGPASSRWFNGSSLEMTGSCNFARIAAVLEG